MSYKAVIYLLFIVSIVAWGVSFLLDALEPASIDFVNLYGIIIAGMSAILGIVFSILIFRIQTLENRRIRARLTEVLVV